MYIHDKTLKIPAKAQSRLACYAMKNRVTVLDTFIV